MLIEEDQRMWIIHIHLNMEAKLYWKGWDWDGSSSELVKLIEKHSVE